MPYDSRRLTEASTHNNWRSGAYQQTGDQKNNTNAWEQRSPPMQPQQYKAFSAGKGRPMGGASKMKNAFAALGQEDSESSSPDKQQPAAAWGSSSANSSVGNNSFSGTLRRNSSASSSPAESLVVGQPVLLESLLPVG